MKLVAVVAVALMTVPVFAQTKSEVFSAADVNARLAAAEQAATASGTGGAKLGDYGTHSIAVSARGKSGGAEVHAHFDDIFYVTGGKATLITGGTVIDGTTDANGETKGSRVEGGNSQTIARGDVVHIPAGVPHQIIVTPGEVYSAIVIKVREN